MFVEKAKINVFLSFKDIRALDKEMRSWDAFNGLEVTVKNMLTSLRAVGELQNPAIRDRHWQQLVTATRYSKEEKKISSALNCRLKINSFCSQGSIRDERRDISG